MEIGPTSLHLLLADLDGRELGRSQVALYWRSSTPASVCTIAGKAVTNLLRNHGQSDKQILGVVAGVPAIVNVEEGVVLSLSALQGWRGVPLGSMLSDKLKCPTIIENDTNLAAQGEHYRGAARGEEHFVFITIGDGVGAGIFVGGRIYHGGQWSAGEIGYLRVPQISREKPTMYGRGKLEKVLGAEGILKSWRAAKQRARMPRVNRAVEVFDLAAAGNAIAKKILTHRATLLADVVLDMALILNPSVILLGGEVGSHPSLLQEVTSLLKGSEIAVTRVALGSLGSAAVLWGAVNTAVESAIPKLIRISKLAG
jgi:glucokinase